MPELAEIIETSYEGIKEYFKQIKDNMYRLLISEITLEHWIKYRK